MELIKKLHIKTDAPLWLINAPENCQGYFESLEIMTRPGRQKPLGQLILFTYDSAELVKYVTQLNGYISHDTIFWICYPKKGGSISSDLIQTKSWDVVFGNGFRGQTSVSIDNDWSALRVTNAPRKKSSDCDLPMAERKAEGIDFINRTVSPPKDMKNALKGYTGLLEYFMGLSFSHKREYITYICEAKKTETRQRRILKTVEMLLEHRHARTHNKRK